MCRNGSGLPRQLAGQRVDLAAPLKAQRDDIRLKVALIGAAPGGGGAVVLAGFDAAARGHPFGARFDLPFDDGKVARALGVRPLHAGQHRPLLCIDVHGHGS
ncbi:hypothetical protein OCAR_6462 [Afipia carboxidovorans OM5]|nr:hypothetical protein OCAR_6462 [Afipia carboxidovorans OM5]